MIFDYDIERRGTSCIKWDWEEKITGHKNLLPFWVADMDFAAPPQVLKALEKRVSHGVFGYSAPPDSLFEALIQWFSTRHHYPVEKEHIVELPGIVSFLHIYIQHFTEPGDAIVIQEPVYYPFRTAIETNNRRVAENPLVQDENHYWNMDLEGLTKVLEESGAKTLILCSPHNPVGRIWQHEELLKLAQLCQEKDVTVLCDEIHCDLIKPTLKYHPWFSLPKEKLPPSLSLVSPTKTFNLPGLSSSWAIIPDVELKSRVKTTLKNLALATGNSSILAYVAAETAWRESAGWLDSLRDYIWENNRYLREYMERQFPSVNIAPLEASYLVWMNLSALGLSDKAIQKRLWDAGVWLSMGLQFGKGGKGFFRMNIACSRNRLRKGLELISKALT